MCCEAVCFCVGRVFGKACLVGLMAGCSKFFGFQKIGRCGDGIAVMGLVM